MRRFGMGDNDGEQAARVARTAGSELSEDALDHLSPIDRGVSPGLSAAAPSHLMNFGSAAQRRHDEDEAVRLFEPQGDDTADASSTAVHTRFLQALPQISQWLHDVNHSQHPLRRQLSAPDDGTRQSLGDVAISLPSELPSHGRRHGIPIRSVSNESDRASRVIEVGVNDTTALNTIHVDATAPTGASGAATSGGSGARINEDGGRQNTGEATLNEEQTAMEELQGIFRRCHHTLPFLALFVVYFAYQHATGILVFVFGTIAVMGLDKRVQNQIALKENASMPHLLCVILMCCIDTFAICYVDGNSNPFRHLTKQVEPRDRNAGVFGDVVWMILVNDFLVRFFSLMMKAFVAGVKCNRCPFSTDKHVQSPPPSSTMTPSAYESDDRETLLARATRASLVSFYRRKRKLYAIIEMSSLFIRSVLAGIPWCAYYQLSSSKLMADVFTFAYLIMKGLTLGSQARRIYRVAQSLVTLKLEYGAYVAEEDLIEAGSPDCSICYESMQLPVKLSCSHMFCEECVTEWFDRERSCPLCRANVMAGTETEDEISPQHLDSTTSLVPQLL